MAFATFDHLEVPAWPEALRLYREAFPEGKPDPVVTGMFDKRMSLLHTESRDGALLAMAISGIVQQGSVLLIDYVAVRSDVRGQGIGVQFVNDIKQWAIEARLRALIIEVESDPTPDNEARIRFWQRCGFLLTDYIHRYIWVPEPYRAMYMPLVPDYRVEDRGESLFREIGRFHRKAFQRTQ
jgi:GNAT superfamily N-acetyltransferase